MEGSESQKMTGIEIKTEVDEVEELFHVVKENIKSEETKTVDTKPAILSADYKFEKPDDGTEYSAAITQSSKNIPLPLLCRLCATPDSNIAYIFGFDATSRNILSMINHCLPVTVKETDTLPKQVCWSCLEELDRCYRLHLTVAKAEKELLAFDRLVSINLEKTDRNDETSAQCDGQRKGTEDDFNVRLNRASDIEPSNKISTSSSERAQTAKTPDETNVLISRLKPCSVVLSTVVTPYLNHIHATSETKRSSDSEVRNSEEFDIETTQNSGTAIRIVQQSTCDSGVSKSTGSRSAAKATQGQETKHKIDPAIHKGPRTQKRCYRCNMCAKAYGTKGSLTQHSKLHTGKGLYICGYCGQKSISRTQGILHQRIHTGERPFECTICDKRFAVPFQLKVHKAIVHSLSDKKDYPCSLCDKSFKALQYRKRHMLMHTDENEKRVWQCDHCKRNFTWRKNLVEHLKRCKGQYRSNNVTNM